MVELFVRSLLVGYSGAIMPGPLFTYAINKSLKNGPITGLLISLGHSVLEFFIVLLLLIGFSKYLGTEAARAVIGIIGGIILIYLAIGMLRDVYLNRLKFDIKEGNKSNELGNMVVAGAVISAFNPGFIFWWAVVGLGMIMSAYAFYGITGVLIFYLGHISADITWYFLLSVVISKTKAFINLKLYKGIVVVMALFLLILGGNFIYGSLKYFIF